MSTFDDSDRQDIRRTYSVEEAAAILGISRTTAYECVKSKELPALRLRGRIVVTGCRAGVAPDQDHAYVRTPSFTYAWLHRWTTSARKPLLPGDFGGSVPRPSHGMGPRE